MRTPRSIQSCGIRRTVFWRTTASDTARRRAAGPHPSGWYGGRVDGDPRTLEETRGSKPPIVGLFTLLSLLAVLAVFLLFFAGAIVARVSQDCSQRCSDDGLCSADWLWNCGWSRCCTAVSDADCRASRACRDEGECSTFLGDCVAKIDADCAGSRDCNDHGRCSARAGACEARSDSDCVESTGCKTLGLCSRSKVGTMCMVTRDADCERSALCSQEGRCTAKDGRCEKTPPAAK